MDMKIKKEKEASKMQAKVKEEPFILRLERPSPEFSQIEEVLTKVDAHEAEESEKCSKILEESIAKSESSLEICHQIQRAIDQKRSETALRFKGLLGPDLCFKNTSEMLLANFKKRLQS